MKKTINNILFIDQLVASKDFACYFLDNAKLDLLNDNNEGDKQFNKFSLSKKNNIKFNYVFVLNSVNDGFVAKINSVLNTNSVVLTTNLSTYCLLTRNNINVVYFNYEIKNINESKSMILTLNKDFSTLDFSNNISIKFDDELIEKELSGKLIYNAFYSLSLIKAKSFKNLSLSLKTRNLIINLIKEQISITNNAMLNVNNYERFNFYKFLSGKNFFKKSNQHIELIIMLNQLKLKQVSVTEQIKMLNDIIELNFNNSVEIKFLTKIISILKNV